MPNKKIDLDWRYTLQETNTSHLKMVVSNRIPLFQGSIFQEDINYVVEPTHLKNTSQIGSFPQVVVKIQQTETTT